MELTFQEIDERFQVGQEVLLGFDPLVGRQQVVPVLGLQDVWPDQIADDVVGDGDQVGVIGDVDLGVVHVLESQSRSFHLTELRSSSVYSKSKFYERETVRNALENEPRRFSFVKTVFSSQEHFQTVFFSGRKERTFSYDSLPFFL